MGIRKILFVFYLCLGASILSAQDRTETIPDSISLYIFLLDDCPICINYTPVLNDLYSRYGDKIDFVGYFPNFSSKPEKIKLFQETYHIEFPLFSDYYKDQAKKWQAEVTPEVFLYNHTKDQIIYQGRIDNKFVKLGKRRNVVTEHDLDYAIKMTLSNTEVSKSKTEAVGCFINFSDNLSRDK